MGERKIGLKSMRFENFVKWLKRNCKTPYRTGNLGHQGNGISATYEGGRLRLSYGNQGSVGCLTDLQIETIYKQYLKLRRKRLNTAKYSQDIFENAPDRIKTPYVPALIRDYEFELYVAGKI